MLCVYHYEKFNVFFSKYSSSIFNKSWLIFCKFNIFASNQYKLEHILDHIDSNALIRVVFPRYQLVAGFNTFQNCLK